VAKIGQAITAPVAQFLMTPVPDLPPPPPGQGYEVKVDAAGTQYRTGALIPTGRTELSLTDIAKNVATVWAVPLSVGGGEALAATELPKFVQQAVPAITQKLTGGLPPWVSLTQSLTRVQPSSTTRLAALKTYLVALVRARRITPSSAILIFHRLTGT
jgi:hypothetical protein